MTEIASRSERSTVPSPSSGTAEHPFQTSGTPHGTPPERPSLKALAHKVLQAEHHAEQERNTPTKTPPEQRSIVPSGGTASGTPADNVLRKPCSLAEQRARLTAACRAQGFNAAFIDAVPDADVDGTQWLSPQGVLRYAEILAARHGAAGARP